MNNKIFVCASGNRNTGGTESLHQLVSMFRNDGFDAYIYYVDSNRKNVDANFKKLNIKIADKILDSEDNSVIVPEVFTGKLREINNCKKIIWWLSKDFYFRDRPEERIKNSHRNRFFAKVLPMGFLKIIGQLFNKFSSISVNYLKEDELSDDKILHLYNCEYVKKFLINLDVKENNLQYLCGPIDPSFIQSKKYEKKKNQICFNPSKGFEYLNPVKERMQSEYPDINFLPLKGMDRRELLSAYKESKLYVDFGFFPGPERMPREAVMSFCNIITGRFGSSNNKVDVPIPEKNKLDILKMDTNEIVDKLKEAIDNFNEDNILYNSYRKKVSNQEIDFDSNIKLIEEYIKS